MRHDTVEDLMVPISEYATVRKGSSLFEAVVALEKVQEAYDHTKYRHRSMLILDEKDQVVGKLGHMDVLRVIRAHDTAGDVLEVLNGFGFSQKTIHELLATKYLPEVTLEEMCRKAAGMKVEAIMHPPAEGEYVALETPLEAAVQQMIVGHHLSLLVTRQGAIIGILRMIDVFTAIVHTMKECRPGHDEEVA